MTRRVIPVVWLLAVALLPVAMALVPLRALDGSPPLCLYTIATGHACWGCGITRALCAAMRGEFGRAWDYNPRVLVVGPVLFAVWLRSLERIRAADGTEGPHQ